MLSRQMNVKRELRIKYRKLLNESISTDYSLTCGRYVAKQLRDRLTAGANVSIFISKFPEISTLPLFDLLFSMGANVFIPAWHSKEMWMCHLENRGQLDELIESAPSTQIPMPTERPIPINSVIYDFIIIPGLVFDQNCHRLGYGYGHYDYFLSRYFKSNPESQLKTKLIGIGYKEQMLADNRHLPFEEHDIQLDEVILSCGATTANK